MSWNPLAVWQFESLSQELTNLAQNELVWVMSKSDAERNVDDRLSQIFFLVGKETYTWLGYAVCDS